MFRSTIIPYTELSKELFFELIKLRIEIFVVEQKVLLSRVRRRRSNRFTCSWSKKRHCNCCW